jgi:hypothetical protein
MSQGHNLSDHSNAVVFFQVLLKFGIRAVGMVQAVEPLPSKHEALNSNSSTAKETKTKH